MKGYYTKFKDGVGQFRFNLKSGNHKIILKCSEGYSSSQACDTGIASVKANSPFDERYERRTAVNDEYYFNLKARNGEIIGVSETYKTRAGREEGINDVKLSTVKYGQRRLTTERWVMEFSEALIDASNCQDKKPSVDAACFNKEETE